MNDKLHEQRCETCDNKIKIKTPMWASCDPLDLGFTCKITGERCNDRVMSMIGCISHSGITESLLKEKFGNTGETLKTHDDKIRKDEREHERKEIIKLLKSKEYHSVFINVSFSDAIKIIEMFRK